MSLESDVAQHINPHRGTKTQTVVLILRIVSIQVDLIVVPVPVRNVGRMVTIRFLAIPAVATAGMCIGLRVSP